MLWRGGREGAVREVYARASGQQRRGRETLRIVQVRANVKVEVTLQEENKAGLGMWQGGSPDRLGESVGLA
jgi:hypothetical protein